MTLFSGWFPRLHPGLSPYLVEDLLQVGRAHAVSQVAVGRVGEEEQERLMLNISFIPGFVVGRPVE